MSAYCDLQLQLLTNNVYDIPSTARRFCSGRPPFHAFALMYYASIRSERLSRYVHRTSGTADYQSLVLS